MSTETEELIGKLIANIGSVVLGKVSVIKQCLVALLAEEHILLEDVPGVGKTLIGRAIAKSVEGDFRRIQFTPDLLPADITGSNFYNAKTQEFLFSKGPVFTNILLADEVNRTTPRTQSAMLEAMDEKQVSIDGTTYELPRPFMVIATENPMEFEGTYPLPENQLDRFLMRISVGYSDRGNELEVLRSHQEKRPINTLQPIVTCSQVIQLQNEVKQVRIDDAIFHYILDIVEVTRKSEELYVGVSTRGAIAFSHAAQALALIEGRDYVIPDDIKTLAVPVLAHRVMAKTYAHGNIRTSAESLITHFLDQVTVPS